MKERIAVIGGGINGLVAANYLQRAGFQVTILERTAQVGGACRIDSVKFRGKSYEYPEGATVLGFMQDFVFNETGLFEILELIEPAHPPVVWFESLKDPCVLSDEPAALKKELKKRWNEKGDIDQFMTDLELVRQFIIDGYRNAEIPSLEKARARLGSALSERWISGTARDLLNYYFTSEKTKIYWAIEVTESGPVSIDAPYSSFTIPLMSSGTIFDGNWGYVKGGLYELIKALATINEGLGVQTITNAKVLSVAEDGSSVEYEHDDNQKKEIASDFIFFATDPLMAAQILKEKELIKVIEKKQYMGTSGKMVLFFKNSVKWKDDTGQPDFDSAFKFVIAVRTLEEFERSTVSITLPSQAFDFVSAFSPSYFEIYCEGAAMRKVEPSRGHDSVSVFFKNLSYGIERQELKYVKNDAENFILKRIENADDFIGSVLLIPKDLKDRFFFPGGNIDHIEICDGQTFNMRTFSNNENNFYQFGKHERIMYCGAGSYPCGSIAGTSGYMCAQNFIRKHRHSGN